MNLQRIVFFRGFFNETIRYANNYDHEIGRFYYNLVVFARARSFWCVRRLFWHTLTDTHIQTHIRSQRVDTISHYWDSNFTQRSFRSIRFVDIDFCVMVETFSLAIMNHCTASDNFIIYWKRMRESSFVSWNGISILHQFAYSIFIVGADKRTINDRNGSIALRIDR